MERSSQHDGRQDPLEKVGVEGEVAKEGEIPITRIVSLIIVILDPKCQAVQTVLEFMIHTALDFGAKVIDEF
jgi:hypothetical protein